MTTRDLAPRIRSHFIGIVSRSAYTAATLPAAIEALKRCGSNYKSCACWDKVHQGMGSWWLNQHELLIGDTAD